MSTKSGMTSSLSWLFPFLAWLPRLGRGDVKADTLAALTGAIVVLPQGVAFATIAGMPPEYGLYAGMVPAIIAALFGSSRHLVSGPTTAASVVLFSALSSLAVPGSAQYVQLALTLTFMVGMFELVLGLARMGMLVNFISHSVVVGFTAGAALLIAAKQLKHFFGIEMDSSGNLYDIGREFILHLDSTNLMALGVALATLLIGIAFKKWYPKVPYMIAAIVGGTLLSVGLNHYYGPEVTGLALVGSIPATLPPLSAPTLTLEHIRELAPSALAVTLFALTEAVSIGRSMAARGGYRIDGNQEFIGQGLSNIAGSFFSGYVATGSFNRSGVNYEAGARSPLAAVLSGVLLMIIVLLVAPLASYMPKAAMAGVLFLVAWGLIEFKEIRHILHASRADTSVLLVTFFAAIFLELEFAIFMGVMLSLVLYLKRTSTPPVVTRNPDPADPRRKFSSDPSLPSCPQLKLVRIDGSIFFGNVNYIESQFDKIRAENPQQKHLAIVANGINFVDMQGAEVFTREAKKRREAGGDFYMIRIKDGLCEAMRKTGAVEEIGEQNMYQSKSVAVRDIYQRLDKSVCQGCDKRIFNECPQPA